MSSDVVKAPWDKVQVDCLNYFQTCGWTHPYTCGTAGCDGEGRTAMVAGADGWECPVCGYRQDWAAARAASGDFAKDDFAKRMARLMRAYSAFTEYDYGDMEVRDFKEWQKDDSDEWTKPVTVRTAGRDVEMTFVVRFKPGYAEVEEAFLTQ